MEIAIALIAAAVLDVEEGALDPDELDGDPPYWDEGADDELDC